MCWIYSFFVFIVFCLVDSKASAQSAERPNIILILADDLGYGDLSCYGGDIPTPNIDRIALEGIRFTDFYASAPACTPSRFSLLTGQYPQRSKHGLTRALMPVDTNYLDTSEKTVAYYLKTQGYRTSLFGKWHLGFKEPYATPEVHDFDEFMGLRGGCIDYFTHGYGQMEHDWFVDSEETYESGYATDLITDRAIRFFEYEGGAPTAPFFMFLSYTAPHYGKTDPNQLVPQTTVLSRGAYQGVDLINSLQAPLAYMERFQHISDIYRRTYAAMVANLDDNIGRLLAKLEAEDMLENTMIWFISDNGGYAESYFGHADNGIFRGEKGTLWEGGIRVPALVMWEGQIGPSQVVNIPLCNIDFLPTIAALVGFDFNREHAYVDGEDISKVLFKRDSTRQRPLYWRYRNRSALRLGDWKMLDGRSLYNLKEDPAETIDWADTNPDRLSEMKEIYNLIDGKF